MSKRSRDVKPNAEYSIKYIFLNFHDKRIKTGIFYQER